MHEYQFTFQAKDAEVFLGILTTFVYAFGELSATLQYDPDAMEQTLTLPLNIGTIEQVEMALNNPLIKVSIPKREAH